MIKSVQTPPMVCCARTIQFVHLFTYSSPFDSFSVKSAPTMYPMNGPQSLHMQHYFKYFNSSPSNFNSLQYPKSIQQHQQQQRRQQQQQPLSSPPPPPPLSRSRPQQPSVVNASNSNARYGIDAFAQHNSSFSSSENSNSAVAGSPAQSNHVKRKRSWSRAVFSQLQRKGLEIQFQIQKYITKPDRRKLAARLGLTDAQVRGRRRIILKSLESSSIFC